MPSSHGCIWCRGNCCIALQDRRTAHDSDETDKMAVTQFSQAASSSTSPHQKSRRQHINSLWRWPCGERSMAGILQGIRYPVSWKRSGPCRTKGVSCLTEQRRSAHACFGRSQGPCLHYSGQCWHGFSKPVRAMIYLIKLD
jgi:hypothetical protein